MRLIYVNMRHIYVYMRFEYDNMHHIRVRMPLQLSDSGDGKEIDTY